MTMTAEQLAQLREVANNATPGEWRYLKTTPFMDAEISAENYSRIINLLAGDVTAANSEFIAAFNPAVVLALLDELEQKDKRITELERHEYFRIRQNVIDGLASSGESWDDIQEYMQKWDAESAGDGINLTVEG